MDHELQRILELSGMSAPISEDEASVQSGLAVKVEAIIIGVVTEFPPAGEPSIKQDEVPLEDPRRDVTFRGNIGIPVTNTTDVTRHQASYYEPEDVDQYESEDVKDVEIAVSTNFERDGIQYVTLYDQNGGDYATMPVTAETDEIINQFAAGIRKYGMDSAKGSHTDFSSYKQAHAAHREDPDDL